MKKQIKQIALLAITVSLILGVNLAGAQAKDTEAPSDVDNVQAVPGDGKIILTWDQATDNVGIKTYKIYMGLHSLLKDGDKYDLPAIENIGNVQTYEIKNLQNGTTYYFAVTALDATGNESVNYSYEASATPIAKDNIKGEDSEAPTVSTAQAISNVEVKVTFSEEIVLPAKAPENAFIIEDQAQGSQFTVISATLDPKDSKAAILVTEPQSKDNSYLLTAGIDITDKAGNHIVSGVSDTAIFKGKGEEEKPATPDKDQNKTSGNETDTQSPTISSAKGLSKNKIQIDFSEEVILDAADPVAGFTINESTDENIKIKVSAAEVDVNDNKIVILTTSDNLTGGTEYIIRAAKVADKSGNLIKEGFESTALFTAPQSEIADLIPPEEATSFLAKIQGKIVKLSWTASINSAGDLVDQILYQSEDQGITYGKGKLLGAKTVKYDVYGLKTGKEYTFKLTVKDKIGNESKGAITKITLPETGPALGLILLISAFGGGYLARKKR